ncbi:MAG: trypsin-like peptidase domain-containing protein [Clostridia bacterium]|nr:trypsin-like peptidase domain-containing protein [Clostridia bacterium]
MKTTMKKCLSLIAFATACMMLGAMVFANITPAASADEKVIVTSPFTEAISQVRDSVVGIRNYQTVRYSNSMDDWSNYFGFGFGFGNRYGNGYGNGNGGQGSAQTQEVLAGTGSGVVIANHYVLTNYHVVEDNSSIKVTVPNPDSTDPDMYSAEVVAYDENLDVAVVYAPSLNLSPVTLGDSDTLQVGDWAICIGNPLSEKFAATVTAGIVSGLNRSYTKNSTDKYGRRETINNTMIQTDAAINNGNSGGGMFSASGELMGIPTLKYSGNAYTTADIDGIGLCIPINAAKPLISDVLSGKIVTPDMPSDSVASNEDSNGLVGKPRLGVTISSLSPSSTAVLSGVIPNGVPVLSVEENGPADKGGMLAGDIIVDVDDTVITSVSQLQSIIAEHKEGDVLKIKVYRAENMLPYLNGESQTEPDGDYTDLEVTLAIVDAVRQ